MRRNMRIPVILGLVLLITVPCLSQMYTVTDLGAVEPDCPPLCGSGYLAIDINKLGQVAVTYMWGGHYPLRAFRTVPYTQIDPSKDDLGTLGGMVSEPRAINFSGQVAGWSQNPGLRAFRTGANKVISPTTDDLETLGGPYADAEGINDSGQVVGMSDTAEGSWRAFRTAPNAPINSVTDNLGTLGGTSSDARHINNSGQVVGMSYTPKGYYHAFRTAPNAPIDPATDDLGTLGGTFSDARSINDSGQVVGSAAKADETTIHAFRTAPNSPINPATDDLGTLGGRLSYARGINGFGQVVGWASTKENVGHAFLFESTMLDLNNLIAPRPGCELYEATSINDAGYILANCIGNDNRYHAYLLSPIYRAIVRPPIGAGSGVFRQKRGVVPVKFTLNQLGASTCTLPEATISVTRVSAGTIEVVDESTYLTNSDKGPNFRIDSSNCQYHYNLSTSFLGVGTYRVDIRISGISVGHAAFGLN